MDIINTNGFGVFSNKDVEHIENELKILIGGQLLSAKQSITA